ncbi:unnamed protein product [Triticum turgidum subsp. durum]|uniref:MSP domain-containing protein n=1 Tax=Triticum turgidum subsp. durum TaxID=4567 RepID=A0A9R1PJ31_TRITD|nr:unnamed protein product [Triticum turgidum subsp. durum]
MSSRPACMTSTFRPLLLLPRCSSRSRSHPPHPSLPDPPFAVRDAAEPVRRARAAAGAVLHRRSHRRRARPSRPSRRRARPLRRSRPTPREPLRRESEDEDDNVDYEEHREARRRLIRTVPIVDWFDVKSNEVKTTSPRKYFVRPNASIIHPWDSCTITITLQLQKEYPTNMQSKNKFLIQSTRVAASTDMDENPPDTFNKEADKVIEEMKLKVVYTLPSGSSDDSGVTCSANRSFKQGDDDLSMLKNASIEEMTLQSSLYSSAERFQMP